jgi:hypothetical protein
VALEGKDVLAGPEDALDALSDRREVEAFSGLVLRRGLMIAASRASILLIGSALGNEYRRL